MLAIFQSMLEFQRLFSTASEGMDLLQCEGNQQRETPSFSLVYLYPNGALGCGQI